MTVHASFLGLQLFRAYPRAAIWGKINPASREFFNLLLDTSRIFGFYPSLTLAQLVRSPSSSLEFGLDASVDSVIAEASVPLSPRRHGLNAFGLGWKRVPERKGSFDTWFCMFLNTASLAVKYLSKSVFDTPCVFVCGAGPLMSMVIDLWSINLSFGFENCSSVLIEVISRIEIVLTIWH
ncbi:hypothetical protein Tco_0527638 [Tanacetum coccineum]